MSDDPFGDEPPNPREPLAAWIDYAVKRGIKRVIAESMTKPDLIRCLDRLESSYDTAVH